MQSLSQLALPVVVGVVAIILMLGMWNMMRGGSPNTSQTLMRARVIAQFAAIVIAMAVLWFAQR